MTIELTPVDGTGAFDLNENAFILAQTEGDNTRVFYRHQDTSVRQEILVEETVLEIFDESQADAANIVATEIIKDDIVHLVAINKNRVVKIFDTDPCEFNYNLASASINEILVHNGDKTSFESDLAGDYSPSASASESPSASESESASASESASES